jgi:hypothetical protein
MASKVIYQRFLWFHNKIKEGKYPNTRTMAENFEITRFKDIYPWIAEQVWHPARKVSSKKDGKMLLRVPVADFRKSNARFSNTVLRWKSDHLQKSEAI